MCVVTVMQPASEEIYLMATYQGRVALIIMPISWLTFGVSGLLIFCRKSSQSNRMTEIMQRLAPDEREYLQQKLDEKLVGLNDEGEIVALNDLLDDQDDAASRTR